MLNIYYQNVRGLRTKTNELYQSILLNDYKIIAFTETWLNSHIMNNELFDSRYTVYRRDRQCHANTKKDGGGVLLAVSRKIPSCRIHSWESKNNEDLWVTVKVEHNNIVKNLAVCVVYLPPVKAESLSYHLNSISYVTDKVDDVLILGDFNLGFFEWSNADNNTHLIPKNFNNALGEMFVDFITSNNLYQFNSVYNIDNRILDLVLSNMFNLNCTHISDVLTKLDPKHPALHITLSQLNTKLLRPKNNIRLNFFKCDYTKIISELEIIDWHQEFADKDNINDLVSIFYAKLKHLIDIHIPKSNCKNSKYPSWFSKALIKMLKEKEKYRSKFRKYNNPRDKLTYDLLRSRCHMMINKNYSDYKRKIEIAITKDSKAFWTYIKNKRNSRPTIPARMQLNEVIADNGTDIANLFASHFSSIFCDSTPCVIADSNHESSDVLSYLQFTPHDVLAKIKRLNPCKGSGPDSVPPVFVRNCGKALAEPLSLLFNSSLKSGIFPDEWKKARIVPVHKKGDSCDIKNYRPISILSCFSKLFECVVCPVITSFLDAQLSDSQHGFRSGRSTETNLVRYVSDISEALDARHEVDAIYTDFSSAFDKVSHPLMVAKLEYSGVHGSLLRWFKSYLLNRSQFVAVNGYVSYMFLARSGVPQGSHLGPVLFSLFVNDLISQIKHCESLLYADDLKIYKRITGPADSKLVQTDLTNIENWCIANCMTLNPEKCFFMRFSKKKTSFPTTYTLCKTALKRVSEMRDLGVLIDDKLNFKAHTNDIVKKSAQMLGFVKRNTRGFQLPKTRIVLFNTLVRSRLEYASVVWNPFYAAHSQRVEGIQRAFTKHLAFNSNTISHRCPYIQRLQSFKMKTLRDRRRLRDLIFLYKIVNGLTKCSDLTERILYSVPSKPPRHPNTRMFFIPIVRSNLGLNAPLIRICNEFNSLIKLTNTDIHVRSIKKFRKTISEIWECN